MPATLHAGRGRIVKCTSYLGFMYAALATTRLILSLLAVDFSDVLFGKTTEREWDELGKRRDAFAVDSARLRAASFFSALFLCETFLLIYDIFFHSQGCGCSLDTMRLQYGPWVLSDF